MNGRIVAGLALLAAALLGSCASQTEIGSSAVAPKPSVELTYDVLQGEAAQVVQVVTRDLPAGGEIPWHTHPGVEIAYVESGNLELAMAGRPVLKLGPGDHFMAPRGVVHSGRNIGATPARLVLTYVVDKGAPLRMPAQAPEGHGKGG